MPFIIVLIAVALAAGVSAAPEIAVVADPPLPVTNLFSNPGLEMGEAMPEGWGVAASQPDVVDFQYHKDGGYSGRYLQIDARGTTSNGYLSQPLSLKPDTLYRAGIWVRMRGGTCVMWLHAWVDGKRFDERAYLHSYGGLPLIPDFLKLEWTTSPDPTKWTWLGREFRTWPKQGNVNPHFGAYFDRGSMDLDEPFIGLARTDLTVCVTGHEIRQVKVSDEAGKCHWDSGSLVQALPRVQQKISDLPTDTRYLVTVLTVDGKETSRWYPEAH